MFDQRPQVMPPALPQLARNVDGMPEDLLAHTGAVTSTAGRPAELPSDVGEASGSVDGAAFHDSDSDGQERLENDIQEHTNAPTDLQTRKREGEARAEERRSKRLTPLPDHLHDAQHMSDAHLEDMLLRIETERQRRASMLHDRRGDLRDSRSSSAAPSCQVLGVPSEETKEEEVGNKGKSKRTGRRAGLTCCLIPRR